MDVFYFKVRYGLPEETSTKEISGLLHARCYSDAAGQIESFYNSELIEILSLRRKESEFGDEDFNLLFLPDSLCKRYVEYDFDPNKAYGTVFGG